LTAHDPFRVLLDASAPDSVGAVFSKRGHTVILHREVLVEATPDEVVCAAALVNDAILVALDNDMARIVKRYGNTPGILALLASVSSGSDVMAFSARNGQSRQWV